MAIKPRQFQEGVVLKEKTTALDTEGQIANKDSKIKAFTDSAERELVTNDQVQTLENKTLDGTAATGNNTITADSDNVSYDNGASGLTSTDVKAAIDELKTGLDNQNEASEITYDNSTSGLAATDVQAAIDETEGRIDTIESATYVNSFNSRTGAVMPVGSDYDADQVDYDNSTSGLTATDVQAAIDEVEGRLDTNETNIGTNTTNIGTNATNISNHLSDPTGAHAGTAISYDNSTSGLAATDVKSAIDEVEGRVDTNETNIGNNATAISNHISDAVGAHAATAISYDNSTSGLTAIETQAAVDEVEGRLDTAEGTLSSHVGASSGVHGITGDVVGTTDTQTLTNKTIQSASIETPIRSDVKQDTKANLVTYALSASNGQFVFATDEKIAYQVIDAGLEPIGSGGSGSGGLNYVTNPDFEADISDFTVYANSSAGSAPDDFGGVTSGNLAISHETASQLIGTGSLKIAKAPANVQGEGVFTEFTIDSYYASKILRIKSAKEFTANYVTGDMTVYMVGSNDNFVSDFKVIPTVSTDINSSSNDLITEFQTLTLADATKYRLCYHIATTSALGYDLLIDNVVVGPRTIATGALITDWEDTVFTGNVVTNATYSGQSRRVGDQLEIDGKITFSGPGAAGTVEINIPNGLSIDTVKLETPIPYVTPLGDATIVNSGIAMFLAKIVYVDATTVRHRYLVDSGVYESVGSTTVDGLPVAMNTGDSYEFKFSVPILGWSSNVDVSSDFGNRDISFRTYRNAAFNHTAGTTVFETLPVDTNRYDTVAGMNLSTGVYTIPEDKKYSFNGQIRFAGIAAGIKIVCRIIKNGSGILGYKEITTGASAAVTINCPAEEYLKKGETVEFQIRQDDSASEAISTGNAFSFFSGHAIQSPETLAGSEVVAMRAKSSSGQTFPHLGITPVVFETLGSDTHGNYNNATGIYTLPSTGTFSVTSKITMNSGIVWAAGEQVILRCNKNGVQHSNARLVFKTAHAQTVDLVYTDTLTGNRGDTVNMVVYQDSGVTTALQNNDTYNFLSIHKIN